MRAFGLRAGRNECLNVTSPEKGVGLEGKLLEMEGYQGNMSRENQSRTSTSERCQPRRMVL